MTTYRARCGALIVRDVTPDRRYRIEVDPTATDPDELTIELEAE